MKLKFKIAESWNELNEYQRARISDLLLKSEEGTKGVHFAILFYLFCPTKKVLSWKRMKELFKFYILISQVPVSELYSYSSFIYEELELFKFPKEVKIKGKTYYGPTDRLSDISIEELNFTYKFYFDWATSKDDKALDRLVTTLYRPKFKTHTGAFKREEFDQEIVVSRGALLPKIDEDIKLSVGLAYKGSVNYMFSRFRLICPKPKNPKKDTKVADKPRYSSLIPMINAMFMGDNQPFGPRESTMKTNAYAFFTTAQETIKQARERDLELKRNRR